MAPDGTSVVTRTDGSAHARLRGVPVADVTLHDGLWQRRVAANREHGIPRLLERMESRGAVDNFRIGQPATPDLVRRGYWFSDSDVYKWVEAAAWSMAGHPDPTLGEVVSHVVDAVVGAQDPDGYLNTNFAAPNRLRDLGWSHELYCGGHLLQAAIALKRVTGDVRLFDAATRFAAFVDDHLRAGTDSDSHPGIEMALVELARETGDARWCELAAALAGRVELGEDPRLWGHTVRSLYFACGLTDLAIETGDAARTATIEALWKSLLEEKSYVTGGVGGRWIGESFGRPYELPNEAAYAETCGGIGVTMWAWRQLLRTGDARFADHLEHVLHNAVLAGVSLEGDEWFYANPLAFAALQEHDPWGADRLAEDMAGPFPLRRRPWRDVACCPSNMVRTLASLPGYVYTLDREHDDLWVNLFTASTVDHGGWRVTQRTDYPWSGRVEIVVDRAPHGRRALVVRIPGWCRPVPAGDSGATLEPGSYSTVRRTWKAGDSIVLDLQMEPEAMLCDPRVAENRGTVALRRGPVVFCLEGADNPGVDLRDVVVDPGSFGVETRSDLLDGVVVLRGQGAAAAGDPGPLYRPAGVDEAPTDPVELAAIPYYAWANRGLHPMTVWARSTYADTRVSSPGAPMSRQDAPAAGRAPLPAADAATLLRRNATDPDRRDRPALKFGDRTWTHGEYVAEAQRFAQLFLARHAEGAPPHVGVLLDNTPDYLFALGGAALSGSAIVGLNHTRRGEHLLHDIEHAHVGLLVTEPRHEALLEPVADRLPVAGDRVLVSTRFADDADPEPTLGKSLDDALAGVPADDPGIEPGPDTRWCLIFTSGTSSAPKAVICTQRRLLVTGNRMGMMLDLTADDVGYVCMPLFHSNALMVGWAPSIVHGASVGLARRFSASRWLGDIRRYGSTYFNYTGKPLAYLLATPEQPDDPDNPLRVAYGNEGSPELVERFSTRFDVEVIDAYGATEGGVAVDRDADERAGALGKVGPNIKIVDEDGNEKPRARFDEHGRLLNAADCVGEMVNTAGAGPFEGYYDNPEANERTLRFGWYWTGDLGYLDDDGYVYFAGRNADWLRVDGENFPAAPIEAALAHHPDVILATVYGVPDDQAGDQVMAGLVLREGAGLDPAAFARWLDASTEIGPKWRPRYLRVLREPPTTGTNKIVKRVLVQAKWRADLVDGDAVYVRLRGDDAYRRFTADDERALQDSFAHYRRERFWEL